MEGESYRQAKEAFVSGLKGTTMGEVSLIIVTLASTHLLRSMAVICLPAVQQLKQSSAA